MSDVPGGPAAPLLRGRLREQQRLDRLLREVRDGGGRVLVLRGDAGSGKTALLNYLTVRAPLGRVVRTAAVQAESEIAYAALQHLCAPLLHHLDRLPDAEHAALATAFGLRHGATPEPGATGPAMLGLLTVAAAPEPLICVVDDVQWLDRVSGDVLTFVARRLGDAPIGLVMAVRNPDGEPARAKSSPRGESAQGKSSPDDETLAGLPELRVDGLAAEDARDLLDEVVWWPLDNAVRERIVFESKGNPLALLHWPRSDLFPYNGP